MADHLGNTRATFDGTGALKQADDYLPFGLDVTVGDVPSQKNNYLYNKKELQDGLGQYDYDARFYDPVIGRCKYITCGRQRQVFNLLKQRGCHTYDGSLFGNRYKVFSHVYPEQNPDA